MGNGLEGKYVIKNNKKMALGYTTGSCAAAAAKAAALMLFSKQSVESVDLLTPKGILLHLKVLEPKIGDNYAICAIQKDAGDDPDVTNGTYVYAKVTLGEKSRFTKVSIDGGIGVGRVTKPGLEQSVGEAAINKVPRQMITKEVLDICEECDFKGEIFVEISIPAGVELAKKTFNPRLGIEGGISVLGTSGIVEPMSEEALIASIRLEMTMHWKNGAEYLVISPGNYGAAYLSSNFPINLNKAVKCSNYVGDTIDIAVELGYKGILFVGHIGKLIKIAGGIMNTHSRSADSRMEILASNALLSGADLKTVKTVLEALTTDEGVKILKQEHVLEITMKQIMEKIHFYMDNRAYHKLEIAVLTFSNEHGELGRIGDIDGLFRKTKAWMEE